MRKMRKMILSLSALLFITLTSIGVYAQQATDKKDTEKKETTTVDAWRQAMPESEQTSDTPPQIIIEESRDNVEAKETLAQIEKRILGLEQRLMEAHKTRDSVALKHLLADDFIPAGANITAAQPDKARYIEWTLKNLELKSYVVEKTTVRAYPSVAVVTVRYKRQASISGAPADGDFIATNVWVRRGKLWQAVSQHVSQMPKP